MSGLENQGTAGSDKRPWEEWQLTAFVLGELEADLATQIETAAGDDAQLSAEIVAIRRTLEQVRHVYESEATDGLEASPFEQIVKRAAAAGDATAQEVGKVAVAGKVSGSAGKGRRLTWFGLAAMAASLLAAVYFSVPGVSDWIVASNDFSPSAVETQVDRPDASRSSALGTVPGDQNSSASGRGDQDESQSLVGGTELYFDRQKAASRPGSPSESSGGGRSAVPLMPESMPARETTSMLVEPGASGESNAHSVPNVSSKDSSDYSMAVRLPQEQVADKMPALERFDVRGKDRSRPDAPFGTADTLGKSGDSQSNGSQLSRTRGGRPPVGDEASRGRGELLGGGMGGYGYGDVQAGGQARQGGANQAGGDGDDAKYSYSNGMGDGYGLPEQEAKSKQGKSNSSGVEALSMAADGEAAYRDFGAPAEVALQELTEGEVLDRLGQDAGLASPLSGSRWGDSDGDGLLAGANERSRRRRWLSANKSRRENKQQTPFGHGPSLPGDKYEPIVENEFVQVENEPRSTFSIDVDTASFTKSRQLLLESRSMPPAGAVRIEEFINYFDYEYSGPQGEEPFGADLAVAGCPWRPEHKLVRIALQATKLDLEERPKANIVFLLDVSGSMDEPNKLPLAKESMRMLIRQLGEDDKVAMAVYAGAAGCVLEGTRGDKQKKILRALDGLDAGGSTNGGEGIQLAYNLARDNFIPQGINRVILCTDGDFNVGVTSTDALVDLVEENAKSKIFLTVLGFGMGNTNDAMMEQISNRGNGVYGFVDSGREAQRQMVEQLAGNLVTVAKDVKIQVDFNPSRVQAYRLLGYENRVLAAEDFNDDKKDAGEIGAGHRVTALYEVVPTGADSNAGNRSVDPLRYQKKREVVVPEAGLEDSLDRELLTVKLRYKQPEGDTSKLLTFPLEDKAVAFSDADRDFRWAASVAAFGMLLRHSQFSGNTTWSGLIEQATAAAGVSPSPARAECLEMIRQAAELRGQ